MNFLDPTDITTLNGTSTPPTPLESDQTLNEEVTQVIGQFSRFWGTVRNQGQAALETARKDFGGVVVQAQKEITKLTANTEAADAAPEPADGEKTAVPPAPAPAPADNDAPQDRSPTPTLSGSVSQSIFTSLQSALPPSMVATVQEHIPDSIKHASEHGIDFNTLRSNLQSEFQRVQGLTRSQAEEYVHKTESLLRETLQEAQEVLRDAVKVVPPDSVDGAGTSMIWDGTDMWMLPSVPGNTGGQSSSVQESHRAVATRAEELLRRLKHDSTIIRHDPEADDAGKELYAQWLSAEVDGKEGGIEGKEWVSKGAEALNESANGAALKANLDTLVPSELSNEVFWKRYFFRVYQIEQEEQKRKAIIADSHDSEDDFSWEDDEEEPTTIVKPSTSSTEASTTAKAATTPSNHSPHHSSEDSYDLISSGPGDSKASKDTTDSDDSDWE